MNFLSGLFNKPTINNTSSVTLNSSSRNSFSQISSYIDKRVSDRIVQSSTAVASSQTNSVFVDIGDITSSASIALNFTINQDIRSFVQANFTRAVVVDAMKEATQNATMQLDSSLQAALAAAIKSDDTTSNAANALWANTGADVNTNTSYHTVSNVRKDCTLALENSIDTLTESKEFIATTDTFISSMSQFFNLKVGNIAATGAVVINLNVVQFSTTVQTYISTLNIASKFVEALTNVTNLKVSDEIINAAKVSKDSKTNTTNTIENVSDVVSAVGDVVSPFSAITKGLASLSTAMIAGMVCLAATIVLIVYLRRSKNKN